MSEKKSSATKRTRNFACIVYPESAPENWLDILSEEIVPAFISPLHDKDVNPTGEVKKAHYHILLMFENVKTKDQAQEIFDKIGGTNCQTVNSLRGYARYLCHLDNPEKYQYSIEDVKSLGGADYENCIGLPTDKYKAIKEMIAYIDDNDIEAYSDLLEISMELHPDWFRVLCDSGTLVMREYLKSRTWKKDRRNLQQES